MFPFRRKRKSSRDVIPAWVKLIVLVFILYAMTTHHPRNVTPDPNASMQNQTTGIAEGTKKTLSEYTKGLMPVSVALRVEDVTAGIGHPIICGQEISVAYEAFYEDGKPVGDAATKDKPYVFRLGDGKAMPALEQGVVGMGQGGKRRIFARNSLAYASAGHLREDVAADAMLYFNVEMLSASPDLSKFASAPFRIADTLPGNGGTFICGQPVSVQVKIWNAEGKKLFESKEPITFTPGKSEVFLGLEQGVIGMRQGGVRTLIVPPSFQKPMHGGKPRESFSLPQPHTVIVDIET